MSVQISETRMLVLAGSCKIGEAIKKLEKYISEQSSIGVSVDPALIDELNQLKSLHSAIDKVASNLEAK